MADYYQNKLEDCRELVEEAIAELNDESQCAVFEASLSQELSSYDSKFSYSKEYMENAIIFLEKLLEKILWEVHCLESKELSSVLKARLYRSLRQYYNNDNHSRMYIETRRILSIDVKDGVVAILTESTSLNLERGGKQRKIRLSIFNEHYYNEQDFLIRDRFDQTQDNYRLHFDTVSISKVSYSGSSKGQPQQSVALTLSRIKEPVYTHDAEGVYPIMVRHRGAFLKLRV